MATGHRSTGNVWGQQREVARRGRRIWACGSGLWICAVACLSGCGVYEIPQTGAPEERVLEATRDVITDRYPMSITSEDYAYVLALTPAEAVSGSTTKKQISVRLVQNYTGSYEPIVRVRQYVDMATASLDGDPAAHPSLANPFADHRWRAMGFLEYEEQELRDAIREKLGSMGL